MHIRIDKDKDYIYFENKECIAHDLDIEYLDELHNELAELEEDYAEGGDFSIDGMWYCHCYKIYQKGEMPEI